LITYVFPLIVVLTVTVRSGPATVLDAVGVTGRRGAVSVALADEAVAVVGAWLDGTRLLLPEPVMVLAHATRPTNRAGTARNRTAFTTQPGRPTAVRR
jgi:hypothetical protein